MSCSKGSNCFYFNTLASTSPVRRMFAPMPGAATSKTPRIPMNCCHADFALVDAISVEPTDASFHGGGAL